MACFNTNTLIKQSSMELFGVIELDDESARAYLKRFSEEMFKVEELFDLVVCEALTHMHTPIIESRNCW